MQSKRRIFQFHLSTIISTTILTGGFIGLNAVPRITTQVHSPTINPWKEVSSEYGWPFKYYSMKNSYDIWKEGLSPYPKNPYDVELSYLMAFADFGSALLLITLFWIFMEYYIPKILDRIRKIE